MEEYCSSCTGVCLFLILSWLQATDSRDALAKAIYSNLFDWLVERINKSLEVGKQRTGRSISILDIYGFESFKVIGMSFKLCQSEGAEPLLISK